jgi:predicted RNA binding protein YcfA (HicA-like mRNA interferase family)
MCNVYLVRLETVYTARLACVVSEQSTRKMVQLLRKAGFQPVRTVGSHTWWQKGSVGVAVPDGHKTISPGVVRKIHRAIEEAGK